MKKSFPILIVLCFSVFLSKAQFLQSEAMSGFEDDVKRIVDQWKPDEKGVLELRFKPYWDNPFFPRKGPKRNSLLLQFVNDTILKQQEFNSPAEYLVKTTDGWVKFHDKNGQRLYLLSRTFIKDSAGYRIETQCWCYKRENCCYTQYRKYDSLNRVIESKFSDSTAVYIYKSAYLEKNTVWVRHYIVKDTDTSLYFECYYITEPWTGQPETVDTTIVVVKEPEVRKDTVTTTRCYQYNKSGKIVHIKRIDGYSLNGKPESEKTECYVIYRKRYPKRRVRELPD